MASASVASELPDPTHLGNGPTTLIHIGIAFLVITWVSMILRVWTRGILTRSLGWDDYTMALTMAAFTVQCYYLIKLGVLEMHPERNMNPVALAHLVTDTVAFSSVYVVTTIVLKLSLALFFLRVVIKPWQQKLIIYTLIAYVLYAITYFGVVTFGCGDPAKYLLHTAEGKCISVSNVVVPMSYAQTCCNALLDWIYVFLPINALWYLQIPRSTKIWASLLIFLGALGSIASLIRLATVHGIQPGHNFFRESVPPTIWATVEPGLGIAAVSLATTRPMFRRFIESTTNRSGNAYSKNACSTIAQSEATLAPGEPSLKIISYSRPLSTPTQTPSVNWADVELAEVELAHHDPTSLSSAPKQPLYHEVWA